MKKLSEYTCENFYQSLSQIHGKNKTGGKTPGLSYHVWLTFCMFMTDIFTISFLVTSLAVAAISTASGFSVFFIPDHAAHNESNHNAQNNQYDNCSHFVLPPVLRSIIRQLLGFCNIHIHF